MKIETKYDLKQEVFAIYENKVQRFYIDKIEITVTAPEPNIKYQINDYRGGTLTRLERDIHTTKESLIASL